MSGITHYQPLPVTSRLAGRLLQQAHASGEVATTTAATTAATTASSVFAATQQYITSSYASASFMSQIVVLVVLGLSGLMVFVLGLMWTAEIIGARRNRRRASAAAKAAAKERGFSTPMATPLSSPDLESPTKQLDDALLEEVSAFNKGVQLVINESTDYSNISNTVQSGGSTARRQLNLKLKASPSLERSGGFSNTLGASGGTGTGVGTAKFSPRDPTFSSMSSMNIMRKVSNTNTNNTNLTSRKDTFGANEHTRVVQPLTMADLSVVESVRNRDTSKQGWSHTPKVPVSRRSTAASSPAASPRDDFSPIGAFTPDDLIAVHNSITQSTIPSTSTASNVSHSHSSLKSALSITPADIAALSKGAGSPDERLNNSIILLSQEQFQNELVLIKLIGTGACGSVHEAIWRGSLCAVKILHPSKQISKTAVNTFRREVELMSTIGSHAGVLKILAACLSPPNLCIVTELATNGSLHALIHERRLRPEYSTFLDLGIQIADAIAFCHSKNLVHRDLKTHNILLDANNDFLVADFGLAMDMDQKCMGMSTAELPMGTSAYMAPEQFSGSKVDDKCDSYAFGCILWECITGMVPWSECNNIMQIVMAVGLERKRPPLPKGVPPAIAAIVRECWRHNSRLRPSMREVADRLRKLQREEVERQTFKAAAEMVTASASKKKGKANAIANANASGNKIKSPLASTPPSPLANHDASKAARAWNNAWSPIKGLSR